MEKRRNIVKIEPIIKSNLNILFIGINPVKKSIKNGVYHYFSSNSYFYTLLKEAGLTDKKINGNDMLNYNLGITNFYYDYFGDYSDIKNFKPYLENFDRLIMKYKPLNVAFLGKYLTMLICNRNNFGFITAFWYLDESLSVKIYCLPFPTYPMKKEEKLKYYKMLR